MKELFIYLVKSGVCIGAWLLIYRLFFRRKTFLKFNRTFLMLGLVLAMITPSVRLSYDVLVPPTAIETVIPTDIQNPVIVLEETMPAKSVVAVSVETSGTTTQAAINTAKNTGLDIWKILFIVYVSGIAFLLIRNFVAYIGLRKFFISGRKTKSRAYVLIESTKVESPFSFFKYIFINTSQLSDVEKKLIVDHEVAHVRQWHWLDLACNELVLLVQWFNPLMWIYVAMQKENHEFLADRSVLEKGTSPAVYQATLVNRQFRVSIFSLSSSFGRDNHMSRIAMIKKSKSSPWIQIAALSIVPFFCVFVVVSATPRYIYESDAIENKVVRTFTTEDNAPLAIPPDEQVDRMESVQPSEEETTSENNFATVNNTQEDVTPTPDESRVMVAEDRASTADNAEVKGNEIAFKSSPDTFEENVPHASRNITVADSINLMSIDFFYQVVDSINLQNQRLRKENEMLRRAKESLESTVGSITSDNTDSAEVVHMIPIRKGNLTRQVKKLDKRDDIKLFEYQANLDSNAKKDIEGFIYYVTK